MEWIVTNWELVSTLAVFLIGLLNVVTTHWSGHAGLVKWGLFITEILSFLASKDVPGLLKLPLTSKAPGPKVPMGKLPTSCLLALVLLLGACALTPIDYMNKSIQSVEHASGIVMPYIHKECLARAHECKAKKDTACAPWKTCDMNREFFRLAIDAVEDDLKKAANFVAATCRESECK